METWPFSVRGYRALFKNFNMQRIYKNINIALIFTLIMVFALTGVGYALRPPLQCSPTLTNKNDKQRLIAMDVLEIPQKTDIGEKPYKLLKMAQAGLNVPPFFIIIGDGSGELTISRSRSRR